MGRCRCKAIGLRQEKAVSALSFLLGGLSFEPMNANSGKTPAITHQPEQLRFTDADGSELCYRPEAGGLLVVTHVEVPEHLRGQGVAPQLMEAMLAHADSAGLTVSAECSYAALYLKRHQR